MTRLPFETIPPFGLALLAVALPACGIQVEPNYRGEPIATMHGTVVASAALAAKRELSAAIVWTTGGGREPRYIGERIDVDDSFPAAFQLNLYAPPPPAAELTTATMNYCLHPLTEDPGDCIEIPPYTGLGLWVGYLAAIDASVADGEIERSDIVGIDSDHMLLYYDYASDAPAPEEPTPKDLAKQHMLVHVDYREPHDAGYILAKFDPERQAETSEQRECLWEGMCVQWMHAPQVQDMKDWEFARCQERFPANPTCSAYTAELADAQFQNGDEPAWSVECRQAWESAASRSACTYSSSAPTFATNPASDPDGFADPVTIQLGKGYWDGGW